MVYTFGTGWEWKYTARWSGLQDQPHSCRSDLRGKIKKVTGGKFSLKKKMASASVCGRLLFFIFKVFVGTIIATAEGCRSGG